MINVCVLRTDGINCDRETKHAFELVGAKANIIHIKSLIKGYDPAIRKKISLDNYDILAIPGGFSYGDYIAAGKIFASDLKHFLGEEIETFAESGKPIIGICNGFQVLVKYALLPGKIEQTTTLTYNDSNRFEDRWIKLIRPAEANDRCIWTKGINAIDLPVAHGEGKFVANEEMIRKLFEDGLVVFQYADAKGKPTMDFPQNPNGSLESIAGICDSSGRIFGLMPHPERYNHPKNHYLAHLQEILGREYIDHEDPNIKKLVKEVGLLPSEGLGLQIFRNAVEYVK